MLPAFRLPGANEDRPGGRGVRTAMLRDVSPRRFAYLLGGPLLTDMLASMTSMYMAVRLTRMGYQPRDLAWLGVVFAGSYTISAHLAGRWTTPRLALLLMLAAYALLAGLATVAFRVPRYDVFLILMGVIGVGCAQYFVPFQVRMGAVKPFSTLAWTVSFYNVSWGIGYAIGPFLGGWLEGAAAGWLIAAAWTMAALQFALAMLADHSPAPGRQDYHPSMAFASTPALRRAGWLGILISAILLSGTLTTLWPPLARQRKLIGAETGLGAMVLGVQMPLWALFWPTIRRRLDQPGYIIVMLLLSGAAFLLLPCLSWPGLLIPLGAMGCAIAGLIYHGVYYSNADPVSPARSVGVNETLMGFGSGLGPLVLGTLAWEDPSSGRPYVAGAVAAVAAAAAVAVLWHAEPRCPQSLPPTTRP